MGWSQKDFADKMGIPQATASDWMTGLKFPRLDKLQKISDVLGVPRYVLTENFKPGTREVIDFLQSIDGDELATAVEIIGALRRKKQRDAATLPKGQPEGE